MNGTSKLSGRKAAYTFIIGNYDSLKEPTVITPEWDYICFTDQRDMQSECWDVRLVTRDLSDLFLENKKLAMKHMILFDKYLPDYDLSLSLGGQIQINCDLDSFFAENFRDEDQMMICRHPERDCIYDEAEACKSLEKDRAPRIDAQMRRYRQAKFPAHEGLYATAIIGRRHDSQMLKDMCKFWYREYRRGSKRDQLSLNFAIWRSQRFQISELDFRQVFEGDRRFLIHPHL